MPWEINETNRHLSVFQLMEEKFETIRFALIVEDETLIAMEMEGTLAAEGFACTTAADQAEVEAMSVGKLAVAIVDLRLRGDASGQSVIRFLRGRVRNLPIVVVTGYSCQAPQADLRGLGGPTIRLHKPVDAAELLHTVREVIGIAHPETTLPRHRRWEDGLGQAAC